MPLISRYTEHKTGRPFSHSLSYCSQNYWRFRE